jgi:AcrR family transcriptional regulator
MSASGPDTRTAILDAAERLFAEHGFRGTTIKAIASGSGQNSALIYYYYDNKETLYRHVITRVLTEIGRQGDQRAPANAEPDAVVRAVVQSQVAVLGARPHLSRLLAREMIDWRGSHAEQAVRTLAATLFERLRRAIETGQRTGRYRADLNPLYAAISIVAQVAYVLLGRPIVAILLGRGAEGPSEDDVKAFGRHAVDFALSALQAPAVESRWTASLEDAAREGRHL